MVLCKSWENNFRLGRKCVHHCWLTGTQDSGTTMFRHIESHQPEVPGPLNLMEGAAFVYTFAEGANVETPVSHNPICQ